MAPLPDTKNFQLEEAKESDLDDMASFLTLGWSDDPVMSLLWRNATPEGRHAFVANTLRPRFTMPGIKTFVIREKASGWGVRPSSMHMFQSHGFEQIGETQVDVRKYGGDVVDVLQTLKRKPRSVMR